MKYFIKYCLLLLSCATLTAKADAEQVLYYYDGSKHSYITDAKITINDILLQYSADYRAYLMPEATYNYGEKISLKIEHSDYQSFDLKAVVLTNNYLYAIRADEMYYSNNGIPTPIYDRVTSKPMKSGYDCMTVVFDHQTYATKKDAKTAWLKLIEKYDLERGYSYQEAIEKNNHDLIWGCRQGELNYTFGLKKKSGKKWREEDAALFELIQQEKGVKLLGIAINRSRVLTNMIEIYYEPKEGVSEQDIEKIEQKYRLQRVKYYYDSTRYYYINKDMIPANELVDKLMQDTAIKQATVHCLYYTECG